MRRFLIGVYWGGLVTSGIGLLPIVLLRPSLLPVEWLEHLHRMLPALLLSGFALLTSVLAAAMVSILREIAALRGVLDRAVNLPSELPSRLSHWTGLSRLGHGKATVSCPACRRTNWTEAMACVDCGAPIASGGPAAAH